MQKMLNEIDKAISENYKDIKKNGKILCGIEETYRQVRFENPELASHIKKRMMQIAGEEGDCCKQIAQWLSKCNFYDCLRIVSGIVVVIYEKEITF